jgi:pseudouridine-5'-phosphate glycosidase
VLSVKVSADVADALGSGRPVVALESTIFSELGLPAPANGECLLRCVTAIEEVGAVAALTAVLDGEVCVGVDATLRHRVLGPARKVAERDLAVAVAQRWEFGATTVSASVAIAAAAGISVFATGGIGGVHRGADLTGDVSADLDALAHHPVIVVSAGAKAFLDLPRTLEYLETVGVPVLGWRHDWFPAFYVRSSGLPVAHRVDDADEVARVFEARSRPASGVLLAAPIPVDDELDADVLDSVVRRALDEADRAGMSGAAITPFLLARIAEATAGASVPANLALAEHNAAIAAEVAVALSTAARDR